MRCKSLLIFLLGLVSVCTSYSSDLLIENVRGVQRDGVNNTPASVIFDLSWKNSWNNEKNHDAVWVFMKFGTFWNNHVKLSNGGHKILQVRSGQEANPMIQIVDGGLGMFIKSSDKYRGDIDREIKDTF